MAGGPLARLRVGKHTNGASNTVFEGAISKSPLFIN